MDGYDGRQFVGIDMHRQRSVIVGQSESGEQLLGGADRQRSGRVGTAARAGWRRSRGGAGSDVGLVLGGRRAAGRRSAGAFGASVGSQRVPVPASEERRARRRRSGRSVADGPTARGVDRPTPDARIAGVGALPRHSMPTPAGRRDDRQPDQSGPAPTYLRHHSLEKAHNHTIRRCPSGIRRQHAPGRGSVKVRPRYAAGAPS
jgi:hypothetical protein